MKPKKKRERLEKRIKAWTDAKDRKPEHWVLANKKPGSMRK